MRHRIELPERLGTNFSLAEATAAGVGRWRRDTPDLHRPFHGIRSTAEPRSFAERIACHQPRMKPGHRYVARTAVRLWGMPHPKMWRIDEAVQVAVAPDRTPPRCRGVEGRRLAKHRAASFDIDGKLVVDPIAAVFGCADELTVDQAVIMIDALITRSDDYPDLRPRRPIVTLADVVEKLESWRTFPGHRTIRAAIPQVRRGVESPKETETRLLIVAAGLPEPVVQHEVYDRRRFIARVDLAYPELKIAIEYEGDGHRTSKEQWRRDIQRQRDLEDLGWIVIRLTQQDLGAGSGAVLARIRRAILARTP